MLLPALGREAGLVEAVMLKSIDWNRCPSRAELDHRARQARLRLERIQPAIAPRNTTKTSWLWRIFNRIGFAGIDNRWRNRRTRRPLGQRRPRLSQSRQVRADLAACFTFISPLMP